MPLDVPLSERKRFSAQIIDKLHRERFSMKFNVKFTGGRRTLPFACGDARKGENNGAA